MWYSIDIMMMRSVISLESELQRRARRRAGESGISFAEYVRRLVARDLAQSEPHVDVSRIFDLGASGGSDIARNKAAMLAEAFGASRSKRRRGMSRP